ncbi:MAG: S-layer homology domain-containing protein [Chloroflexi bacterium]|nr:S-layer homology domain-containing protein [Chloroflexota bacterium]
MKSNTTLSTGKSIMRILTILLVVTSMLVQATPARAATITVTSNADSGAGSLRAAIAAASGGDTINFGAGLSGQTITLESELSISVNLTIDGSTLATPVTLDGIDVRAFLINGGTTVTLNTLNIVNNLGAGTGGGIRNLGTLTVLNSTISGNNANSASGKGGGIYNSGTLTVTDSTISSNTANGTSANSSGGGGIYNSGTLTVDGSTFSGNGASSGNGGAIYNAGGTVTISNSTFSGNSASSGGGIFNAGTITIRNSTFSGNSASVVGGGVDQNAGTLNMANVILANSPSGFDCYYAGGTLGTNTKNIIENNATSTFACSAPYSTADPVLGSLASNGGPTQTMSIGQISPALNTGDAATCTTVGNVDQRNTVRPQGTVCDIGAYEAVLYKLTVNKTGSSGTGTISSSPDGISCGSGAGCNEDYIKDTVVTLTATPDPGSIFNGWSGGGCSGTGTCQVTMDAAKTVTGVFISGAYLFVSKNGAGSGTVASSPSGISCGATCLYPFALNTIVTLTAVADSGSTFAGWSGEGCSGTGTCQVTMSDAKAVYATFNSNATPTYNLSVVKLGTGTGLVTSSPAGVNCGATCSFLFNSGTLVTLTASPDAGSTFAGWSGEGCSGTGTCQVTMSAARAVVATFNVSGVTTYTLDLTKNGTGTGTVTSNPTGINCGLACSSAFNTGTVVTLTATPDTGSTFAGWTGGGCTGTGTCDVTMSSAQSVTATFNVSASSYLLLVSKVGTGTGVITSDVGGIDCGATCSVAFNAGTIVTLTATPDAGIPFNGWIGGGCSGTGTCAVTMSSAQTVHAVFGTPTTFTDVPITYWAYTFIERLYNAGITAGCTTSPLAYCPDATVTRAQMAIFILRGMHGSVYTPPAATGSIFTDVPATAFAAAWIEQFFAEGITGGCGTNLYCPNSNVTRAQMAIFLLRGKYGAAYVPPTATGIFTDVPVGSFAADWIEKLAADGITSGCGTNLYCPNDNVTRAQMAVFLVKTFNLP